VDAALASLALGGLDFGASCVDPCCVYVSLSIHPRVVVSARNRCEKFNLASFLCCLASSVEEALCVVLDRRESGKVRSPSTNSKINTPKQ
jgi:hypothetical protein